MKSFPRKNTRRTTTRRQIKQRHLLDVNVRARTAAAQRVRRVVYWMCWGVVVAAGVAGAVCGVQAGLKKFFWQNPDYNLSEIAVRSDGTLTKQQILDAGGIREGVNIFSINLARAQEKIAQLPQVEHVELQRTLPNKIAIEVVERKPVAWLTKKVSEDPTIARDSFLVDRRGVLMRMKNPLPEYLHLPVIAGLPTENFDAGQTLVSPELKSALDLIRLASESALQSRFQVRSIDLSKGYCMVVTNQTHAQITFGLDRVESQLERLAVFLDRIDQSRRELRTINLMVQRNVPVTYAPLESGENKAPGPEAKPEKTDEKKSKTTGAKPSSTPKTFAAPKAAPIPKSSPTPGAAKAPAIRRAIPMLLESFHNSNG